MKTWKCGDLSGENCSERYRVGVSKKNINIPISNVSMIYEKLNVIIDIYRNRISVGRNINIKNFFLRINVYFTHTQIYIYTHIHRVSSNNRQTSRMQSGLNREG